MTTTVSADEKFRHFLTRLAAARKSAADAHRYHLTRLHHMNPGDDQSLGGVVNRALGHATANERLLVLDEVITWLRDAGIDVPQ